VSTRQQAEQKGAKLSKFMAGEQKQRLWGQMLPVGTVHSNQVCVAGRTKEASWAAWKPRPNTLHA